MKIRTLTKYLGTQNRDQLSRSMIINRLRRGGHSLNFAALCFTVAEGRQRNTKAYMNILAARTNALLAAMGDVGRIVVLNDRFDVARAEQ